MPVPFNKNSMEIAFGDEKARPAHREARRHLRRRAQGHHQRAARPGGSGAAGGGGLRLPERIPLLHPEAMGTHARGGGSLGDRARARVHLPATTATSRTPSRACRSMATRRLFESLLGHETHHRLPGAPRRRACSILDFAEPRRGRPLGGHPHQGRAVRRALSSTPARSTSCSWRASAVCRTAPSISSTRRYDDDATRLPCGTVNYHGDRGLHPHHRVQVASRSRPATRPPSCSEYSRAYEDPKTQIPVLRHHQRRQRRALRTLPPR